VRRSILDEFPDTDISVSVVWIRMLDEDSEATAKRSADIIDDPRVRHFHDLERRSGMAIADGLGWRGRIAWDIYLFYDKSSVWTERPPAPADFMHQLSWEPSHFRTSADLQPALHEAMQKMLEEAKG
jgi:hypothetical protein